jgi:hypothetical protein
MIFAIKMGQILAESDSATSPISAKPDNLEKSLKVTLTARVRDNVAARFRVTVYIQNEAS